MARVFKRGKKWWIDYYHAGKRYRESVGPSKRDAERALMKRMTEIMENKFLDVRVRCKTTLSEFIPRYLEWARANKRSWKRDELSLGHLAKRFGHKRLDKIKSNDVVEYGQDRQSGKLSFSGKSTSAATANREIQCLRSLLKYAVDIGRLANLPRLPLFEEPPGRCRYLSHDEMTALVGALHPRLRPFVRLAYLTGMRLGEIVGLRWDEVVLENAVIHLSAARTKEKKSRDIPLSKEAMLILWQQKNERNGHYVFEGIGDFKRSWKTACKSIGLADFTFRDLRHCLGHDLALAGTSIDRIADLLGSEAKKYRPFAQQSLRDELEKLTIMFLLYDYRKHGQAMTLDEKLAFFEAYKKAMGQYPDPYGEERYQEMLEAKKARGE